MPWDIDFVLGLGNGPGDGLWGDRTRDSTSSTRPPSAACSGAYHDAVNGPMLPENYGPQIECPPRRAGEERDHQLAPAKHLHLHDAAELSSPTNANDAAQFAITSNGGRDFSSTRPTTTLAGTAPRRRDDRGTASRTRELTDQRSFSITIPLTQPRTC